MTALTTVAHLAATDPEFQTLLAADPEAALRSRHLSLGTHETALLGDLRMALTHPPRNLAELLKGWGLPYPGWK